MRNKHPRRLRQLIVPEDRLLALNYHADFTLRHCCFQPPPAAGARCRFPAARPAGVMRKNGLRWQRMNVCPGCLSAVYDVATFDLCAKEEAIVIRKALIWTCAVLVVSSAAAAQTRDDNWNKCKADDPDTSISGCTALIQAGQESTTDLASAYYNRGLAYRDKKQYDLSIQDLNESLQIKPDFASALNSRGNDYDDEGQYDRAIQDFNQCLQTGAESHPRLLQPRQRLGPQEGI